MKHICAARSMRQERLELKQAMVEEIVVEDGAVRGVRVHTGMQYSAKRVVVTTGTFLRGLIHIGELRFPAGRAGEFAAEKLSGCLRELGFELGRLKTGTTPRIDKKSVDLERCEVQEPEPDAGPFSFVSEPIRRGEADLLPVWLTYTNERTREVIARNLERSAMYGGRISGIGPRDRPSIEDKIVKFPDKLRHQVFLEQEGWDTDELYVQGMSTSMPEEVQIEFLRTIPGLENVRMIRPGYAIEYDFAPPTQLKPSLETKLVEGLFFAGQINGTSGYEEAAAQGLMAGINACRTLRACEPIVIGRSEGYIGVMIDDLVTKGVSDPYRLLTSRAEIPAAFEAEQRRHAPHPHRARGRAGGRRAMGEIHDQARRDTIGARAARPDFRKALGQGNTRQARHRDHRSSLLSRRASAQAGNLLCGHRARGGRRGYAPGCSRAGGTGDQIQRLHRAAGDSSRGAQAIGREVDPARHGLWTNQIIVARSEGEIRPDQAGDPRSGVTHTRNYPC